MSGLATTRAIARDQGGTLDLHADPGQQALVAAGLLDQFFAVARPEGEAQSLLDAQPTVLFEQHAPVEPGWRTVRSPAATGRRSPPT